MLEPQQLLTMMRFSPFHLPISHSEAVQVHPSVCSQNFALIVFAQYLQGWGLIIVLYFLSLWLEGGVNNATKPAGFQGGEAEATVQPQIPSRSPLGELHSVLP